MNNLNLTVREVPETNENRGPRKATLDFLRQFARCYQHERSLGVIGGMVLN
ncbi:MAG: hypothetical protein J1E63_04520 [Muribaculaceae bacterium]|nr:hypothetical protein [Muribaculaceae bacterium]